MIISGRDLRLMRLKAGKTTTQMAEAVGVKSRKTCENWEKEVCSPTINQYLTMVKFCGFDAGILLQLYLDRSSQDDEVDLTSALIN